MVWSVKSSLPKREDLSSIPSNQIKRKEVVDENTTVYLCHLLSCTHMHPHTQLRPLKDSGGTGLPRDSGRMMLEARVPAVMG